MSSDTSPPDESSSDEDVPHTDRAPAPELTTTSSAHWSNIFPFDTPYPNQTQGIKSIVETGRHHGFSLIEGACGTGKTLMGLTGALSLVRNPESKYERILVITSVKQQMAAFEDDIQTINEAAEQGRLPIDPVTGTTLVGKGDICPYSSAGDVSKDDIYSECQSYREDTTDLIEARQDSPVSEALSLVAEGEQYASKSATFDGIEAPFGRTPMDYGDHTVCPFYAQYKADQIVDDQSIPTDGRMLDRNTLRREAVNYGTCPHSVMTDQIYKAEVVIGNYYHVFDPLTRDTLLDPIIDDSTFLIIDESHMLVERVRDLLSDSTTHTGLKNASDECKTVLDYLTGSASPDRQNLSQKILADAPVEKHEIGQLKTLLDGVHRWMSGIVTNYFANDHAEKASPYIGVNDEEIPLRDPQTPRPDDLSQWLTTEGYNIEVLENADEIGGVVGEIISAVRKELEDKTGNGVKHAPGAGRLLRAWHVNDHEEFFREIRLEDRGYLSDHFEQGSWKATHKARLYLNNCIPSGKIATRLNDFGGGVLMSATLAPIEMYQETVGLNYLTDRPTNTEIFGLTFPSENRDSFAVDLPSFSYANRGPTFPTDDYPRTDEQDEVRARYLDAMESVCTTTPGNVLLVLPSYSECEWAAQALETRPAVSKAILCDESSTDNETSALKQTFFDGEAKILLTSARGTLTEGVDYADDRLASVAVVGVPIVSTAGIHNAAIETAYEERYGEGAGFIYAFTIPAIWKTRQALGRVIRGDTDVGTRVLLDGRYTQSSSVNGKVYPYIPDEAYEEYQDVAPETLHSALTEFWT